MCAAFTTGVLVACCNHSKQPATTQLRAPALMHLFPAPPVHSCAPHVQPSCCCSPCPSCMSCARTMWTRQSVRHAAMPVSSHFRGLVGALGSSPLLLMTRAGRQAAWCVTLSSLLGTVHCLNASPNLPHLLHISLTPPNLLVGGLPLLFPLYPIPILLPPHRAPLGLRQGQGGRGGVSLHPQEGPPSGGPCDPCEGRGQGRVEGGAAWGYPGAHTAAVRCSRFGNIGVGRWWEECGT